MGGVAIVPPLLTKRTQQPPEITRRRHRRTHRIQVRERAVHPCNGCPTAYGCYGCRGRRACRRASRRASAAPGMELMPRWVDSHVMHVIAAQVNAENDRRR